MNDSDLRINIHIICPDWEDVSNGRSGVPPKVLCHFLNVPLIDYILTHVYNCTPSFVGDVTLYANEETAKSLQYYFASHNSWRKYNIVIMKSSFTQERIAKVFQESPEHNIIFDGTAIYNLSSKQFENLIIAQHISKSSIHQTEALTFKTIDEMKHMETKYAYWEYQRSISE